MQNSHESPPLYARVWRLEDQVRALKEDVSDHDHRLTWLERAKTSAPAPTIALKEAAMIAAIGILIGLMWATGDPAGVLALIQRAKG